MNEDLWDEGGHWLGPHDVRTFVGKNRFLAAIWYVFLTLFACVLLTDVLDSGLFGVATGFAAGGAVWFAFMFGFSHGWIAEGN